MKILIFNQYFWPENFHINQVALALSGIGHEVEVITGKPNYPHGKIFDGYKIPLFISEKWNGILINRIPLIPRGGGHGVGLILNYISFVLSGILFSPLLLRKKKFDVIFVYAPSPVFQVLPAIFLRKIKGIPIVLWVQDLWPESAFATGFIKSRAIFWLLEKCVSFCYGHVDLILVQSKAFVEPVRRLSLGRPVVYHPNSVDDMYFNPREIFTAEIESLASGFTVLFAGNIGAAQSIQTVLDAAEELKSYTQIKIVFLGGGSKEKWLTSEVAKKGLKNVFFEGIHSSEHMPDILRKASVLLVSLTNSPIFSLTVPNKIQAYFAVGRPIIASLNGEAARMVIEAGAGLACPAEDSRALAGAILSLYNMDVSQRNEMGKNGREYFKKNFDCGALAGELVKHFKFVIDKKEGD